MARQRPQDELRACEYRADAERPELEGYAARYLIPDNHGSVFARGAFRKTLAERGNRLPLLFNHDPNQVIGRVTEARSDSKGLKFKANVIEETALGKDVMALVRAEALSGMSFAFRSMKERPGTEDDQIDLSGLKGVKPEELRFITEAAVRELTVATFPSNLGATITAYRSEDEEDARLEDIFEELRSFGIEDERLDELLDHIHQLRSQDTPGDDEPPNGTPVEESRHKIDMDIDLLLLEVAL